MIVRLIAAAGFGWAVAAVLLLLVSSGGSEFKGLAIGVGVWAGACFYLLLDTLAEIERSALRLKEPTR